jgi:hypothetical protein
VLLNLFYIRKEFLEGTSKSSTAFFTVYIIVNKSFYCVIGFDIIQAYHPRLYATAVISQHLDLTLLYADWTDREINSLTHSHRAVLILFL